MSRQAEVIVALDTASAEEALGIVDLLGEEASFYKVGLELYTRAGRDVVSELVRRDKRVFLDLKLYDIPNTVEGAARAAADLGVDMLTVHASGGAEMISAARRGLDDVQRLLAVTVLTSLAAPDLGAVWGRTVASVPEEVLRLADLSRSAGADGVVCAAPETPRVRAHMGDGFLVVVPGIRPAGFGQQDQKRVATPGHAVQSGADFLVVGRPIIGADDPAAALRGILEEIRGTGARA